MNAAAVIVLSAIGLAFAYLSNIAGFRDAVDFQIIRTFVPPT